LPFGFYLFKIVISHFNIASFKKEQIYLKQ